MSFTRKFDTVQDGENVQSSVTNRPINQLANNLNYLNDQFAQYQKGAANLELGVSVSSDTVVGSPVYLDEATGTYKAALATYQASDVNLGLIVLANSARVWGVVVEKHSSTLADIAISGVVSLDISAAISPSASLVAGVYYLSGVTAGRLTLARPPIGIPVLQADGNGKVQIFPSWQTTLDKHYHYSFKLQPQFCGTSVTAGTGTTTINGIDTALEGWLPADHASFNSKAPAGAKFGYNIAANSKLNSVWPPIPIESAYLEWNRGATGSYGQSVPLGTNQFCSIDQYGIWWFGDATDKRPWDESLNASGHIEDDYYTAHVTQNDADLENFSSLILWFNKPLFANENSVVTSLTAAEGSRLSITCPLDGSDASTGNLEIDLELDLVVGNDNTAGYLAVKSVSGGNSLARGPIVEGVYPASNNVIMSGDATSSVTIDDESTTIYHGKVSIDINPETNNRELEVFSVKLLAANEDYINQIPVISLPSGRASAIRGVINVPTASLPDSPQLKLRFQIAGSAAGALPELTFNRRRILKGSATPASLPTSDVSGSLDLSDTTLTASLQYIEASTAQFTVAGGDTVLFSLERANGDGYGGTLHIVQMMGVLVAAE